MGIPAAHQWCRCSQEVSPVTLHGYVLALCLVLGSLLVLATVFYVAIRVKRKRLASALQRQVT